MYDGALLPVECHPELGGGLNGENGASLSNLNHHSPSESTALLYLMFALFLQVHVFEIKISIIATLQKADEALSEESIHENLDNDDLKKAISKEQILGFLAELRKERKVVRLNDANGETVWTVPDKVRLVFFWV